MHVIYRLCVRPLINLSPVYRISSKRSYPYIKTFSTLQRIRIVFWISSELDILCTSAVKRYCTRNKHFAFDLFSAYRSSHKQHTCQWVYHSPVTFILCTYETDRQKNRKVIGRTYMYLSCMQWKARYPVSNTACGIVNHNFSCVILKLVVCNMFSIHLVINHKQMQTDEFI